MEKLWERIKLNKFTELSLGLNGPSNTFTFCLSTLSTIFFLVKGFIGGISRLCIANIGASALVMKESSIKYLPSDSKSLKSIRGLYQG
jgi:hypothetical protein